MERKRIITVTTEEARFLEKLFGVSNTTVWHALKYKRSNDIHKRIRKAAIERGNPQMVLTPEFDTIYLTNRVDADAKMTRYMVQTFPNGTQLMASFATGRVELFDKHGKVSRFWDNVTVTQFPEIQAEAMAL